MPATPRLSWREALLNEEADPYVLDYLEQRILERALERETRTWATWGTIYLLHFDRPFKHAKHYLGFALNFENRLNQHMTGKGSSLTRAAHAAGVRFELVRTWEGDRNEERRLKNYNGLAQHCPKCIEGVRERARERMRIRRG